MSKITIDTIKSEDARFQIENYTTNGRMLSKAAISAVVKAERQAEERMLESFKQFLTFYKYTAFPTEKSQSKAIETLKEMFNNGNNDPRPIAFQGNSKYSKEIKQILGIAENIKGAMGCEDREQAYFWSDYYGRAHTDDFVSIARSSLYRVIKSDEQEEFFSKLQQLSK